jgi:hypothetical protein
MLFITLIQFLQMYSFYFKKTILQYINLQNDYRVVISRVRKKIKYATFPHRY